MHTDSSEEVSLLVIFTLLRSAWKIIAITALLGLALSCAYLFVTPKQYEAGASFAIGRKPPSGALIEQPSDLVARLRLNESFDNFDFSACGLQKHKDFAVIASTVRISQKSTVDEVSFTVTRPTFDEVKTCFNAVVDFLADSQMQLEEQKLRVLRGELAKINKVLVEDRTLLERVGPSSTAYFQIVQEIRTLETNRQLLLQKIDIAVNHPITVLRPTPIYSYVGPKKITSIAIGLLGGIFLGLAIALGARMYAKLKGDDAGSGEYR